MTRINVYLPDDLASAARKAGLNLSAVTREAVIRALAERATDVWLATLAITDTPEAVPHDQALAALDAVRADPATRHG